MLFVEQNVSVVHVAGVEQMKAGLVQEVVVRGLPCVFDECDGDIAKCW